MYFRRMRVASASGHSASRSSPGPQLAVLGVGTMGAPIAEHLQSSGHEVAVFDLADDRLTALAAAGVGIADSAEALFARADILLTVLPGPSEVQRAMSGAGSALHLLRAGACWIDLSSNDPRAVSRLASEAESQKVLSVEAPMGGSRTDASAGTLSFFVSGSEQAVEVALPILQSLSRPGGIHRLGTEPGAGNTAKLLANLLWFGQSVAVTEALLLGRALGLDIPTLRSTLSASAGGSRFIDEHLGALLEGDYLEDFGIDRVVEELDTLAELAEQTATPFSLSAHVTALHHQALEAFGPVGGELLAAKLLEQQAGGPLSAD